VLLALCGCHQRGGAEGVGTLDGLTVPLLPSPALRVALGGSVRNVPAVIELDPGAPISFVTRRCVASTDVESRAKVADAFGPDQSFDLVRVEGLEVQGVRLRAFQAGLFDGKGCTVVLGADLLHGLALEVAIGARTVKFLATRTTEAWLATVPPSDEVQAIPLTKDPQHDWPLLAVRTLQGDESFVGSLLFSVREPRTRVYDVPARSAGLKPGLELLQGLPLPEGLTLPKSLQTLRGFAVDRVELAPGFGVSGVMVDLEAGAPPHGVQGVLGADVWGRFNAIIDLEAGVVVLHRPRTLTSGTRAQCERAGQLSEEACFEFSQRKTATGTVLSAVVWRALPDGAHLSFDLVGGATSPCRVGLSFSSTDRARSTAHELPWKRLSEVMPTCAAALAQATSFEPSLLEEGALPGCPGTCAFAHEIATGKITCECQPVHAAIDDDAEKDLLKLYRQLLEKVKSVDEHEPSDPE
jgi:hypothetical protein